MKGLAIDKTMAIILYRCALSSILASSFFTAIYTEMTITAIKDIIVSTISSGLMFSANIMAAMKTVTKGVMLLTIALNTSVIYFKTPMVTELLKMAITVLIATFLLADESILSYIAFLRFVLTVRISTTHAIKVLINSIYGMDRVVCLVKMVFITR